MTKNKKHLRSDSSEFRNPQLIMDSINLCDFIKREKQQAIISIYKEKGIKRKEVFVSKKEISETCRLVSKDQKKTLCLLQENVQKIAERELKSLKIKTVLDSSPVKSVINTVPIETVGIYIPRNLPSSLIFYAQMAKTAGVKNIFLALPPEDSGIINPLLMQAAYICNLSNIIAIGGRAAFPALAFLPLESTVDKLYGPCNSHVSFIKSVLSTFYKIPIDIQSGPSEMAVFFDEIKDIQQVELDIRAQMEHGSDSKSFIITTSKYLMSVATANLEDLKEQIIPIYVKTKKQAISVINTLAPEIVEIYSSYGDSISSGINKAGNVYVNISSVCGDYCLFGKGCSDPTFGMAKGSSGITISDFMKNICVSKYSGKGKIDATLAYNLATLEKFTDHTRAVERFLS